MWATQNYTYKKDLHILKSLSNITYPKYRIYGQTNKQTNRHLLLKWPYAITTLTANFTCGLLSDLMICKFRKSMVRHDTKCPYWGQVSLNNTNQTRPNPFQTKARLTHTYIPSVLPYSEWVAPILHLQERLYRNIADIVSLKRLLCQHN